MLTVRSESGAAACCWFVDPREAKATLEATREANPDVEGLHLGVTPLGVAFGACGGWVGGDDAASTDSGLEGTNGFDGELRLVGTHAVVSKMAPQLQEQLKSQGIEPACWSLPVFCCDELQSAAVMPMFMSHEDLAHAWVLSGRKREELPEQITVMDLRLLAHQMQTTDNFAWSTVQILCSKTAIELVEEAKAQAQALVGIL